MGFSIRTAAAASVLLVAAAQAQRAVINEIHFESIDKTAPEEFIELHNPDAVAVDLSNWQFTDGVAFTFPEGVILQPDAYVVVAEDPEALQARFGQSVEAFGPWTGRLDNEGERTVLRDATGQTVDVVSYGVGFPWPIAPAGKGGSLELINPDLDNNLAGSWRAAGLAGGGNPTRRYLVNAQENDWHFRKGTSNPPPTWRTTGFAEDGSWQVGRTSIGYGDGDDNTTLNDMQGSYSSVYLRRTITIDTADDLPTQLMLGVYADDGAVVWINDQEVGRVSVPAGPLDYNDFGVNHEAAWEEMTVPNPASLLQVGENIMAIHALNTTISSSDFSIDVTLFVPAAGEGSTGTPTPGAQNSVYTENAPPQIRQVHHTPLQPPEGDPIIVTAKVTDPDGVASVLLHYQIVAPGDYVPAFLSLPQSTLLGNPTAPRPPNPAFEDPANWTSIVMHDDGTGGDTIPGDGIYAATIPGHANRTLVRYRIAATDTLDATVQVPYADDKSLNFACFVYDGVPPYETTRRSVQPQGAGYVYGTDVMRALPVYIVITRDDDLDHCIGYSSGDRIPKGNEAARDKFNWEAAFVYEGVVYDHIRYRLRQANDRYGGSGKRSFRFRFNKGKYLVARDNYGKIYPEPIRTLNTGKMFDNKRVGNFGLTETMNHDLWNLAGLPAPWVHTFHLRIVRDTDEAPAGPDGQYFGDFFGMHINFQDYDPRFLRAHGLDDGNLYKLKDGIFNGNDLKRNQGRVAVTDDTDFQNIRSNLRPERTNDWLNAHVNYPAWYPYHTVVEAIRHYDFRPADSHSKNRAWYFEPDYSGSRYGRLWTMPWDSDASWGPNWNSGIDYTKNAIFSGAGKEPFKMEYRNVMREFRDLIWTQEVIHRMIDDLAERIVEFAKADRDRYRSAPAAAGSQDFGTMEAKVTDMKRFAFVGWSGSTGPTVPAGGRAQHLDNLAAAEGESGRIPRTPSVTAPGRPGYPIDDLTFEVSTYSDPQNDPFGAVAWRIGEITPPGTPFDPDRPRIYEWPAVWEEVFLTFMGDITIPDTTVKIGSMYRVRARMQDATGRWSHWSAPVQFVAGEPLAPLPQLDALRITEVMYHPQDDEDCEFIEVRNIGTEAVDLSDVHLDGGVKFSFGDGDVTVLDPGAFVVVVRDRWVFAQQYDTASILVAGEYNGNLGNDGDHIDLAYGAGIPILAFDYLDTWHPTTDGGGYSLVVLDHQADPELWTIPESWRPSQLFHGSPGRPDLPPGWGLQRPGDMNQDGRLDISDPVGYLRYLFGQTTVTLPCGDGTLDHESNRTVYDVNGDSAVNVADAVAMLAYLFAQGPPPAAGTDCVAVSECPSGCFR